MKSLKLFVIGLIFFNFSGVYSQTNPPSIYEQMNAIIVAAGSGDINLGLQDVNTYLEGYVNPMAKGLGYGFANGWYNTAENHKPWGFDLTINMSLAVVPDTDLSFNPGTLNQNTVLTPTDGNLPTIFSSSTTKPTFENTNTASVFEGLEGKDPSALTKSLTGLNYNTVPLPTVQVGIGLIKETDIKIRYAPPVVLSDPTFGDLRVNLYGLGVMHNISQYLGSSEGRPFELSAFAGITRFNLSAKGQVPLDQLGPKEFLIHVNSITLQAIISKKIKILTLYGAAGINNTSLGFNLNGKFNLDFDPATAEVTDPVDLNFLATGARLTGGFRVKLAIVSLHADYTLQKYPTLTAGFGITIR